MDKSKKVMAVLAIVVICSLLIINSFLFVSLNNKSNVENEYYIQMMSNWYCIEGVYNTQLLYEKKYAVNISKKDYNFLTINICGKTIWENLSWAEQKNLIDNYSLIK